MASYCRYTCRYCGRLLPANRVRSVTPDGFTGSRTFQRHLPLSPSPPHIHLTSEEVSNFPAMTFPGRLYLIPHPSQEVKYLAEIRELMDSSVLGCDTESKPKFHRSGSSRPCLVQLASRDICVMWRLRRREVERKAFPPMLEAILNSPKITKVGHNLRSDAILILQHFHVSSKNFADTEVLAKKLDLSVSSLSGLAAMLLGWSVCKHQSMSNWERDELTPAQLEYAATDAWASLEVYLALLRYAAQQGVLLPSPMEDAWGLLKDWQRQKLVYKMRNKKTPRKGMRETEGGQLPPSHQPSPVAITSAQKGNNPTETTLPAANGNQNCDSYPYLRNMLHRVSRLMRSRKGSSHDDDQGNG